MHHRSWRPVQGGLPLYKETSSCHLVYSLDTHFTQSKFKARGEFSRNMAWHACEMLQHLKTRVKVGCCLVSGLKLCSPSVSNVSYHKGPSVHCKTFLWPSNTSKPDHVSQERPQQGSQELGLPPDDWDKHQL